MKSTYQERINTRLKAVLGQLFKGATATQQLFTQQFYANVPVQAFEKWDAAHAASVASYAYGFMEQRQYGDPKIRIFTPNKQEHGYESQRLVIELLNDDMPFLVDSLTMALSRLGFAIHETIHPIYRVVRGRSGGLESIADAEKNKKNGQAESFIHFEVSQLPIGLSEQALTEELLRVLRYARAAVSDWPKTVARIEEIETQLPKMAKEFPTEDVEEASAFLAWLKEKHFIFLGYADGNDTLGICALDDYNAVHPAHAGTGQVLTVLKSDRQSIVHRPVLMDVILVRTPMGERQIVGLFTSRVYYQTVDAIPLVRRRLTRVTERAGLDPASHSGKALRAIIEFMPRDELFQYTEDELLDATLGILAVEAKPSVRLFVRKDLFERFVSCMVFIPREYFSTELRRMIVRTLAKAYRGEVETFYTQMTESALARIHLIIRTTPGEIPDVDAQAVEEDISRYTHQWEDKLREQLLARTEEQRAEQLFRTFASAFPSSYVSRYNISATVYDIERASVALESAALAVDLYRTKEEPDFLHLKIYNPNEEIALSDIIPMLENMGFRAIDEHPFLLTPQGSGTKIWIRDIKLSYPDAAKLTLEHLKPTFEEALLRVWQKEMENDRFNALVLSAGLDWRRITMLRAYAKYLKQIGFSYAQPSIEQAFLAYPRIAQLMSELFIARFDPAHADHEARSAHIQTQLEQQLEQVASLSDDRILRAYMQLMDATLRTNFFQRTPNGGYKPVLSFKFNSAHVPNMPRPVPFAEIFVYGMRVEGIHLRGGKVARGGLRWSDRTDDFRTEILGLMKAQMVKNSVIVPVGSKGGFVLKQLAAHVSRETLQEEGIACYTLYLQGLLDITDNVADGKIVPPPQVRRYDGDDPYLVVAADKGTASFSDIANGVSRSYGFWLDDAFASGGSAGYDHKEMGITARGGWISVTRHFREMGVDINASEFTAVGIGDMGGDVFGNGMLLSRTMKLIAAFNHMHIFLDPAPNPEASFKERERLFHLPRSTWKDYDAKLISAGGGVFERSAKMITLSPEIRTVLGIETSALTPDELIRAILTAPVDLLWNGGIGTYVKAEDETHDQVGDRANNNVRVNGQELRCKVVGEGGNLGFTQKGRIEYARMGGRINTDAIDNSGGVDCSDHEVNIKLAFASALGSGKLTREQRNKQLVDMTDEVAALVLKDNFLQTQAISLVRQQGASALDSQERLMQRLERAGLLSRAIEYLPDEKKIAELRAAGKGLTRPELAVLLAYSKIALYREIVESTLPDEPYFASDLARYFPEPMKKRNMAEIEAHPLKREIIATVVTNSLINRTGITFFFDISDDSDMPTREVAAAYTIARDAFSLRDLWQAIEDLGSTVDTVQQMEMLTQINLLIERVTQWGLRRLSHPIAIETAMAELKPGVDEFKAHINDMHSPATLKAYKKIVTSLGDARVPGSIASAIASLDMLASAGDVLALSKTLALPIAKTGKAYFALGNLLRFGWLRHYAGLLKTDTHWDRVAANALIHDLYAEQRRITESMLAGAAKGVDADAALEAFTQKEGVALARYLRFMEDLRGKESLELSALLVALKQVKMLG